MGELRHNETKDLDTMDYERREALEIVSEIGINEDELSISAEEADKILQSRISGESVGTGERETKGLRVEETIFNDLALCNPHYKEGRAYRTNTPQSLVAYEMRRRGYDVTALPQRSGVENLSQPFSMWRNPQVLNTRGNGRADIEKYMSRWGDGARAEVVVTWKGGQGGHIFVAEQVNGKTRYFDPQSGYRDVTSYFDFVSINSTKICRIDHLDFGERLDRYCEERNKTRQQPLRIQPNNNQQNSSLNRRTPTIPKELKPSQELRETIRLEREISDALDGVNPNFKTGQRKWSINCQRCAPTYELRRRGYDVTALPLARPDRLSYQPFSVYKNPEVINARGNGIDDIERYMRKWGDGARAEIVVTWKGQKDGHAFVAEQVDGKTRFYDPQDPNRDARAFFNRVEPGSVRFCRTDKLSFNEELLRKCCV